MTPQILDNKVQSKKKKVLNHLGKIGLGMLVFILASSPAGAATPSTTPSPPVNPSEATKQASGLFQGSKKAATSVLKGAKKVFHSTPAMIVTLILVLIDCFSEPER